MGKNYGSSNGVCRSLRAVYEIGGIKVLIVRKNMFLQFRNAFKESFMDCSPIMSHEQSGKSRHGFREKKVFCYTHPVFFYEKASFYKDLTHLSLSKFSFYWFCINKIGL